MRKQKKVSVVGFSHKTNIGQLQPGDKLTFQEDPTGTPDPDAIKVLWDGEFIGYVGQKYALPDTDCATTLKSYINDVEHGIVETITEGGKPNLCIVITEIVETSEAEEKKKEKPKAKAKTKAGKKKKDEIKITLSGTTIKYPGRVNLIQSFKDGKKEKLAIQDESSHLLAYYAGKAVGVLSSDHPRYADIQQVVSSKDLVGTLIDIDETNNFIVNIDLALASNAFEEDLAALINKGFKEEEIQERITYLKKSKISEDNIKYILGQIQVFPKNMQARIKKPKVLFVEYGNYVSAVVEEINAGNYVRLVGNKACGKNTLTETLAWVYNRPVFELPGNESTDKYDMLGSPKLETNENGELNTPYEASAVIEALEVGGFLIIDEVNLIRAGALSVLNGFDSRKRIEVAGYGRVDINPHARVFLTMNEGYVATMPLNEATVDRFEPVVFKDPESIEPLLKALHPTAPDDMVATCQNVYRHLKDLNASGAISSYAISIRGMQSALEMALLYKKPVGKYLHTKIAGRGQDEVERTVIHDAIQSITGVSE